METGAEQIPIPCSRCGAPMRELPHADPREVIVGCDYCRTHERLPGDLQQRVLVLRSRLQHLASAKDALRGPARFVEQLTDSRRFLPMLLVPIAAVLLQLPAAIGNLRPMLANPNVPRALRAEVLSSQLTAPTYLFGIVTGMLLALVFSRWHYQHALRPHYLARAPMQEGLPTRCRRCGGRLPAAHGAFTTCPHCRAQNLVTPEVAQHRIQLLQREAAEYSTRAQSAQAAIQQAASGHGTIYLVCWVAGAGLGLGLGYAARSLAVYWVMNPDLFG